MKISEIIHIAKKANIDAQNAFPLKNEASLREYWRIISNEETYILCYLDTSKGNHKQFCNISNQLKKENINASRVVGVWPELGITIQEDLGDDCLLDIMKPNNKEKIIYKSLDLLAEIQKANISGLKKFTYEELLKQQQLFSKSFCDRFLKILCDEQINLLIEETIPHIMESAWMNCHYDYERRNLFLKDDDVYVIDYQDMRVGPIGLDLAGILLDHYYDFNKDQICKYLAYYESIINLKNSKEDIYESFRWCGIQRNMRILGTLSDLYMKDKRDFRLKDLPRILDNLYNLIPDRFVIKNMIQNEIKPSLKVKLNSI